MPKSVFQLSDGEVVSTETEEEREKRKLDSLPVQEFIDSVKNDLKTNNISLPTLPTLALEALLVINDAGSSASDLEKVISKDAALTARLIRYANSPLYRGTHTITSIKVAITRIGFQRVKNAVYAVSMKEVFRTPIKVIERRMEQLWAHSVKVGAHAAVLAKGLRPLDPDTALVAGLVHDIGKIPLLIKACDFPALTDKPEILDKLLHKLHPQVGGNIAKIWKFDTSVIQVAAEHENLKRNPGDKPLDYLDLIQVANVLSYKDSDYPLAKVDHNQIPAFKRVMAKTGKDDGLGLYETTKEVEDILL